MVRFIIALVISILVIVMAWPYLRHYVPRRGASTPRPASKGELIYFAILTTVALTFAISTMLWVFGK
jgi:hypothetical protein